MSNTMFKIGSSAGKSVNYLTRRKSRKIALSSYLTIEAAFTTVSVAALVSAKMYSSAILGLFLLAFLLYATYGLITELD